MKENLLNENFCKGIQQYVADALDVRLESVFAELDDNNQMMSLAVDAGSDDSSLGYNYAMRIDGEGVNIIQYHPVRVFATGINLAAAVRFFKENRFKGERLA